MALELEEDLADVNADFSFRLVTCERSQAVVRAPLGREVPNC
jgi:hypothetical protein